LERIMIEVLVSRDCDLSAEVAYELLADFGNTSWMKGVAKTEVDGDGVGMVRNIYVDPAGAAVVEKLTARDDAAHRIDYEITENNPLPVENYQAWIEIAASGAGCRIDWCSTFEAKGVDEATAKTSVEGMYGVLIDWLLGGLD
jgi:hypothetical protein